MEIKIRKIALIGAGKVGMSFLYNAIARSLADEYGIIDLNQKFVDGNVLDLEDTISPSALPYQIKAYSYADLKDVDLLVITAGTPQMANHTRLDMALDNVKIMQKIANEVKKSGFTGITLIASNPVDIMTQFYQEFTGFDSQKVIGTGTALDSARLQVALSKKTNISPQSIAAYVIGEHGDSSVSVFSSATIATKKLVTALKLFNLKQEEFENIHLQMTKKGYDIVERKGGTFYGIGAVITDLALAIFKNTNKVYPCSAFLKDEYQIGNKHGYIGTTAILNSNGVKQIIPLDLNEAEAKRFKKSITLLQALIADIKTKI